MPLNFGEEYASGLTVYMDLKLGKIIGLVSHGSSDFVFGQAEYEVDEADAAYDDVLNPSTSVLSSGTPIYFAFARGEYLTSAWWHDIEIEGTGLWTTRDEMPPFPQRGSTSC